MRTIDGDVLFREMEKAQWYNNADRDEIAEELVLNAPTIEPHCETCEAFNKTRLLIPQPQRKRGMWIEHNPHKWGLGIVFECSECGEKIECEPSNFCPNCGADMRTPVDIAKDIVHKIIDNTAWSDAVDTAEMHKAVDDKYAEIRGDANVDAES